MELGEQLTLFIKDARAGGLYPREVMRQVRREFVMQALAANRGNQTRTARELGWHRNTLLRVCSELAIDMPALRGKPVQSARPATAAERQA